MRDEEFERVVEEICFLLKLDEPSTHQVVDFYRKFTAVKTHNYRIEVVLARW